MTDKKVKVEETTLEQRAIAIAEVKKNLSTDNPEEVLAQRSIAFKVINDQTSGNNSQTVIALDMLMEADPGLVREFNNQTGAKLSYRSQRDYNLDPVQDKGYAIANKTLIDYINERCSTLGSAFQVLPKEDTKTNLVEFTKKTDVSKATYKDCGTAIDKVDGDLTSESLQLKTLAGRIIMCNSFVKSITASKLKNLVDDLVEAIVKGRDYAIFNNDGVTPNPTAKGIIVEAGTTVIATSGDILADTVKAVKGLTKTCSKSDLVIFGNPSVESLYNAVIPTLTNDRQGIVDIRNGKTFVNGIEFIPTQGLEVVSDKTTVVVMKRRAYKSAYNGNIEVETSKHELFSNNASVARATQEFAGIVLDPEGIAKIENVDVSA